MTDKAREDIVKECPHCHGRGYVVIAANYPLPDAREPSSKALMAAQQVLAPDRIGFNVHIHLTTGLVQDALRAAYAVDFPTAAGAAPADGPHNFTPDNFPDADLCRKCGKPREAHGAAPADGPTLVPVEKDAKTDWLPDAVHVEGVLARRNRDAVMWYEIEALCKALLRGGAAPADGPTCSGFQCAQGGECPKCDAPAPASPSVREAAAWVVREWNEQTGLLQDAIEALAAALAAPTEASTEMAVREAAEMDVAQTHSYERADLCALKSPEDYRRGMLYGAELVRTAVLAALAPAEPRRDI